MRPPLHLRLTSWIILLSYFNLLCPVASLWADVAPAQSDRTEVSTLIRPPEHVQVNRTLPAGVVQSLPAIAFSSSPTDAQISAVQIFPESLVPLGRPTTAEENAALGKAIALYEQTGASEDLTMFTDFLAKYPDSAWAASLHLNLGLRYFSTAYFSKALSEYASAWALSKNATDEHGHAIGDRSIGELLELNARFGRFDILEKLFKEIDGRIIRGTATELVTGARDGLWLMEHRPQDGFRCGSGALDRILAHQDKTVGFNPKLMASRSTSRGMSLTQVWRLAKDVGLDYQMAKREPGAPVLAPAVVNWKVGHYSALLSEENGVCRLEDPTFGEPNSSPYSATQAALNAEASGYFLVPAGPLPAGWRVVNENEGKTVWGKGAPSGSDPTRDRPYDPRTPPDNTNHCGMPVASATLMICSLNLTDTPLFYTPPKGPAVIFTLTYNQREAGQPSTFNYGNVGNKWTHSWLSSIDEARGGSTNSFTYTPTVHLLGGGTETYPASAATASTDLVSFTFPNQIDSHVQLSKTDVNTYTQTNPDGSRYIYGFRTGAVGQRSYFLTQIIDPSGNALTLSYDSSVRLVAATDALGQVTTLSYNLPGDPLKLTQITDPFGRTAQLGYNSNGQLSQITDILGLTSQLAYQSGSDFISSLKTPYGTSTFAYGENGQKRWLILADPNGNAERVEYDDSATFFPAVGAQPAGMNTNFSVNFRDTFYWDKRAYHDHPGDVTAAHAYHWLHNNLLQCSGTLGNEKSALEGNRIYYAYEGQGSSDFEGATGNITTVGRVLDDGTTQLYNYTYNSFGRVLTATDPQGRINTYVYAVNGVDLLEIDQSTGTGGQHDILAKFTYNSQHLPLTATDASGQVTTYTYNTAGQPLTITNAKNQTTGFTYDGNGYLLTITLPPSASGLSPGVTTFTYDGYGRVRTVTDSEGYTVTTDYDVFNRPTVITYPDGTTVQNIYDKLDLAQQIDRRGHVTEYRHNALRQLSGVTDPLGRITQYDWCGCGALSSLTDPAGQTTSWTYDTQDRVIGKLYPDGTGESYTYEATTSRLKSVTDAKSQVTNYKYNLDNSLQQVSYTNAVVATPTVSYTYDPNYLRIASMTDGIGTTNYAYNPVPTTPTLGAGRLASVSGPLANSAITYTYDELGRVLNEAHSGTVNSQPTTVNSSYVYDALGRVASATNPLGTFGYTYVNQTGRVAQIAYPNGQVTNYGYYPNSATTPGNDDQRLAQIQNLSPALSPSNGSNLSTFNYSYDANGTIQTWGKQNDAAGALVSSFIYDPVGQLISASVPQASGPTPKVFHYVYDKAGNRTAEQIGDAVTGATANNLNQVTALSSTGSIHFAGQLSEPAKVTVNGLPATVDSTNNFSADVPLAPGTHNVPVVATDGNGNASTKTYQVTVTDSGVNRTLTYDANGNLTNDGAGKTFTYDAANRLISVTQNGTVTGFVYDGFGRRVQETQNGSITKQWVWSSGTQPDEERDASNNVTKRFNAQGEQINGVNYYFTTDQLGSVREMTDSTGAIRARYDYDPYGRVTKLSGDLDADFGFQGMYYHAASGLSLTYYRAYDPALGRWTTPDPSGEAGGVNLFQFVGNDPINATDPLGLFLGLAFDNGKSFFGNVGDYFGAGGSGALHGAEAFADGANPFGNPFASHGFYNPCDKSLQLSRHIGTATAISEGALGLGAAAFYAPGTSIFYSGGQGAAEAYAAELAGSGAASTIYDTVGGGLLQSLGVTNNAAWGVASWFYANTAGSSAIAILGAGGGTAATAFGSVELPVLAARAVQVIFLHI
jgi:RHS repeat-associated protein